jgi:hypothetical protein
MLLHFLQVLFTQKCTVENNITTLTSTNQLSIEFILFYSIR